MKMVFYSKFSKAFLDAHIGVPNETVMRQMAKSHIRQQKQSYLEKGIVIKNFTKAKVGLDGDDFVKDLITVIIHGDGYRIPRFLKTYLLKRS